MAVWLVLVTAGALLAPRFEARLTGPPLSVAGSDSGRVQNILETRFDEPFAEQDLIVFDSSDLVATDPEFQRAIEHAVEAVGQLPGVSGVIGPYDPRAQSQVSKDGHIAVAVVGVNGSNADRQALAPHLTDAAQSAATPAVRIYVTGSSPLIADLVAQEHEDLGRAERLGLPLALVVLLIASGTLVAAGLPLLLAIVGVAVTFGALGAASSLTTFNLFVPNITTMIGLGVGIDYSLFIVTRFREEIAHGREPNAAVATTLATAGKTVFASATTVLLSLAGLLLVNAPIFHQLAIGAMTAVAVMVLGALTLVPATLAILGRRVERLRLPWWRRPGGRVPTDGFWARWAHVIMAHPGRWAIAVTAVLLILAFPVTQLKLSLDTGTQGVQARSAGAGREILEQQFNAGRLSPVQIAYVSRDGKLNDADLEAIARLSAALKEDWAVADVVSVTDVLDRFAGNHTAATLDLAAGFPQAVSALSDLVNFDHGQDIAIISAVPKWSPDSPGPITLVKRIRNEIVPRTTGNANADVMVGGLSAQIVDITAESQTKLPLVGGLVILLSFLFLALVFRSLILPLKAILMNGMSIGAAYGLLVVVFQEGYGQRIFDFTATGTTQVYLPLLSFAVLFGLSMDYEVFLLGRIKEEWERTGDNRLAVGRGLERTAGVITSAAAIMVVVFAAFTFARLREVKELGFSLAAAVLIDATLVRLILVPAAMQLLGHWNWWFPAWLDRIVPRIDLAEGGPEPLALEPPPESEPARSARPAEGGANEPIVGASAGHGASARR
jgi:putative drug exporter of the RND superfamily